MFGENHLEARPTVLSKPAEVQSTPFLIDSQLTSDEEQFLAVTLKKIREHLKLRQSSIKPFFKDFDKLYTGYVTKSQFRQCLTYAQCHVNDQEYNVLSKKWGKYKSGDRVCYLLFLKELENDAEAAGLRVTSSQKEQNVLSQTSQSLALSQIRPLDATEIEMLINRIKTKVKTERIRVIDFMSDFDGLKHGKITKNEFRRGLNVLFVNLTEVKEVVFGCTHSLTHSIQPSFHLD